MSSQNKKSKADIVAARVRIEKHTIVIEQVIVRQDVMVLPFDFINQIFQENGWQSMFTCNKVFTRLVGEFYGNLKIDQISPILKAKVRGQAIIVDHTLISTVAHIPLVPAPGILWTPSPLPWET
jgi:hypothetical protein